MREHRLGIRICLLFFAGLLMTALSQKLDPFQEDSVAVWEGHEDAVTDVAFLKGGNMAVSSGLDGTIRLWDTETGRMQKVLYSTQDEIFALDISADGSKVISTEYKGQVHVHDIEEGSIQHLTGLLGWSADIIYSPDSNKAAAWNMDGDIWIWNTPTGEHAGTLKGQKNKWGMALAWSPEGTWLASGRVDITIWDIASKNKFQTLEGHKDFIRDLVFSPDGQYLASACMDKTVRVWDISTGKVLYVLRPQGLVIYLKSGPVVNPISLPMSAVAFSPDGKKLATGGADRVVRMWDAAKGELLHEYKGHRMSITAVVFSPDGTRLLSSSLDHTIRVWDAY